VLSVELDRFVIIGNVLCFGSTYGDMSFMIIGNLIGLGLSEIIYGDMLLYLLLF
jgi:hypothetical protein